MPTAKEDITVYMQFWKPTLHSLVQKFLKENIFQFKFNQFYVIRGIEPKSYCFCSEYFVFFYPFQQEF